MSYLTKLQNIPKVTNVSDFTTRAFELATAPAESRVQRSHNYLHRSRSLVVLFGTHLWNQLKISHLYYIGFRIVKTLRRLRINFKRKHRSWHCLTMKCFRMLSMASGRFRREKNLNCLKLWTPYAETKRQLHPKTLRATLVKWKYITFIVHIPSLWNYLIEIYPENKIRDGRALKAFVRRRPS